LVMKTPPTPAQRPQIRRRVTWAIAPAR
jgi:hypothetical protein